MTLDEVLQEYSINLAKGVQNMVHSFSCKPVYSYMSVDRGYFSNLITRRYSTSAIDKRDIENLGEKKLKINMDSSKIDQLKKYKGGYKSYINIFNMKNIIFRFNPVNGEMFIDKNCLLDNLNK